MRARACAGGSTVARVRLVDGTPMAISTGEHYKVINRRNPAGAGFVGSGEGEDIMKTVSLIAAGLLAFGLTAARAEVGATDSSGTAKTAPPAATTVEVTPPSAGDVDIDIK